MITEIAKFTFPKILKTGDIVESKPYNCQKLEIVGLSVFPEQFLYKDLIKLLKRTSFSFFIDGKIYLKYPLYMIPVYPYPFSDHTNKDDFAPFYDLRISTLGKTMNNELLPLSANEVMCRLETIDHIKYNDDETEIIDTSPFEINKHSALSVHLTDSLVKNINK